METITHNGIEGVFIPNNEFEYIKETIKTNGELLEMIIKEVASNNPNTPISAMDYLLKNTP